MIEQEELWVHASLTEVTTSGLTGNITIATSNGKVVALVEGLTSRRIQSIDPALDSLYEVEWVSADKQAEQENVSKSTASTSLHEDVSEDAKTILISFDKVSTDGTKWQNLVISHANGIDSANPDKDGLSGLIKMDDWKRVIFVANSINSEAILYYGIILLKKLEESVRASQIPDVWFLIGQMESEGRVTIPGAGLQALARSARMEMPDVRLRCVQVFNPQSATQISNVLQSIDQVRDKSEYEFRMEKDADIKVPRLVKHNPISKDQLPALSIDTDGTYIISGGLGGLGLTVAGWLIENGARYVALLSRSGQDANSKLADLRKLGSGAVEWFQCNIISSDDLANTKEKMKVLKWPVVKGIFHAAGALADGTLRTINPSSLRTAYSPKVEGAKNLCDAFPTAEYTLLFSSASALFGSPGQANYSSSNATMDALAEEWCNKGRKVVSIQWGAWSESGMAVDQGALKRIERLGFESLRNRAGLSILTYLLRTRTTGVVCATPIFWTKMKLQLPLLKNFKTLMSSSNPAKSVTRSNTSKQQKLGIDAADVDKILQEVAREVLGKIVDGDAPLMEAGLDSLGAVEFRNRLSAQLGMELPSIFVYNYPSLNSMAAYFSTLGQAKEYEDESTVNNAASKSSKVEPIAVISMACRLPGGITTPDEFWTMLKEGRDCVSEIPSSRFDMSGVHDPSKGAPGKSYTNRAALMSDVEWFDHDIFGISHSEAKSMDPQQRLLLEVGYEALARAGYDKTKLRGSDTGVFVGQMNYDWMMMNGYKPTYGGTGFSPAITANRVSYIFGLNGPSMTIDTACSSSLVALDSAVEKLKSGKCSLALVGGVNVMLQAANFVGSSAANMLSHKGRCATFDAAADGYCRGEGVACVVLKPLSTALRDKDNILALIKGTAVNQDGRSASLTAPSGQAQVDVIQRALREARLSGRDVDYVECHGTGTELGDPIEVEALKNVLGENRLKPVILGALKTNIGHLEGAAGLAGLIKAVLVLKNRQAPPNVHFEKLNPKINLDGFDAIIPTQCTSFLGSSLNENGSEAPITAGVSSFGFGGTNAHAILQSWKQDKADIAERPTAQIAWLFTGQGSQYTGMGSELYKQDSIFKAAIDRCSAILQGLIDIPLLELLFNKVHSENLNKTTYSQPAILSVEYALSEMWKSREVTPSLVIGHSVGEFAAAVVCGVMKIEDALTLVTHRGRLMDEKCERGAMAAVFMSADEIRPSLPSDIYISAMNGPTLTVLSGKRERLMEVLNQKSMKHSMLQVENGFHSPLMDGMLEEFRKQCDKMELKSPAEDITFISTVTGLGATNELTSSDYWVNQIKLPVNFQQAMLTAADFKSVTVHIELGPKPVLIPMAKRFVKSDSINWITTPQQDVSNFIAKNGKATSKTPVVFNRKYLPWNTVPTVPSQGPSAEPVQETPIEETTKFSASDCLYETVWEKVDTEGKQKQIEQPMKERRCLLISHGPVKVLGTIWANAVHVPNTQSTLQQNACGRFEVNLRKHLEEILSMESWSSIVLLATDSEEVLLTEFALRILKFVGKSEKTPGEVWFVTQKKNTEAGDMEALDYTGADLRALTRTAHMEMPQIPVYCMLTSAISAATDLASLCEKAISQTDKSEREFRITERYGVQVSRLARMTDDRNLQGNKAEEHSIRASSTYVITGGMGALGLVVTRWLVDRGATHIVLLSRSKRSNLSEQLKSLCEGKSVSVEWMSCDVADVTQVLAVRQGLRDKKWPSIAGIFHSAGLLQDSTILNLDPTSLSAVRSPKVKGSINLKNILAPKDFLMLFSSASAVFGSPGQANYAIANAEMDTLAEKWNNQGTKVFSIQWGAWSEAGMAAKKGAVERAWKQGYGSIDNALGIEIIDAVIGSGNGGVICATPILWSRIQSNSAFVKNLAVKRTEIMSQVSETTTVSTVSKSIDFRGLLHQVAIDVLGFKVDDEAALVEAGMDSLGAVEFRNQLSEKIGQVLPAGILFDYPSISALAQYLVSAVTRVVAPSKPVTSDKSAAPVLVIGGGLAGLSVAKMLLKSGKQVIVMEANKDLGGVWKSWANATSKLQIDAPSYDFGCFDMDESVTWPTTYPTRQDIQEGVSQLAANMGEKILMVNTRAEKVTKLSSSEYRVDYTRGEVSGTIKVGGVVAMTGGLHVPREINFNGEESFQGIKALGIKDDVPQKSWNDSEVVIVGHGAFAVENMRTAFENGAKHVTILCRKRALVVSSFCNWLLNSHEGNMPVKQVLEVMRPLYTAAGINIEELSCFTREKDEVYFDQHTVPPASDLYFIAQALGRLDIIEDEVDHLTTNKVVTKNGRVISANIVLKCIGFHTKRELLENIFGKDYTVEGLWINGDRNLFTYNDGDHVSRKVRSLLCSSYLFFVQSYTSAYIHYRDHPDEFQRVFEQLRGVGVSERHNRLMIQLWDFLAPAKSNVAQRTRKLCPFNTFMSQREQDWTTYINKLHKGGNSPKINMWDFTKQVIDEVRRREPKQLIEERQIFGSLLSSVYRPLPRYRVLFLHGQGTNASLANYLLESNGWTGQLKDRIEFVIPDAPHELKAFTNRQQLTEIGLNGLVDDSIYDTEQVYREWGADFDWFADVQYGRTDGSKPPSNLSSRAALWKSTIEYLRAVIDKFGPFDGIAGFCEGAAVAAVALRLQKAFDDGKPSGVDFGLGKVRFFIALAGWRNPFYEHQGLFQNSGPLSIPSLHVTGRDDMDIFRKTHPTFVADFADAQVYEHGGKHVYPLISPTLKNEISKLLDRAA